jgi:small conductance mechanosensitive channel
MKGVLMRNQSLAVGLLVALVLTTFAPGLSQAQSETELDLAVATVEQEWVELEVLLGDHTRATGDERLVLDARINRRAERVISRLSELADLVEKYEAAGGDAGGVRESAGVVLDSARGLILGDMVAIRAAMETTRKDRDAASAQDLLKVEQRMAQSRVEMGIDFDGLRQVARIKESLGIDAAADWADLDARLTTESLELVSGIEVVMGLISAIEERLDGATGSEEQLLKTERRALRERLLGATGPLQRNIDLMELRELETSEFKQLLIRATGNVTTDILDSDVALGLARQAWQRSVDWLAEKGPQLVFNLVLFLLIVGIFWLGSRFIRKILVRALAASKMPELLRTMTISAGANGVLLIGLLIGFEQLGFELGPLLAGLGVAGFVIGFALQNSLSNFASGLMILIYRPFDVGDVIEAGGVSGTVREMSLVSATILTFDNDRLIVPNNKIWGDVIRNRSTELKRRVDMVFTTGDEQRADDVLAVLREIVDAHELVLAEPEPAVKVHKLGDSTVDFIVRPWVVGPDYWTVYWDVTREVKRRFDDEVLAPPHPKQQIRVENP